MNMQCDYVPVYEKNLVYDEVSDLMHNAVAMCQQNSDALQDSPKDLIDS